MIRALIFDFDGLILDTESTVLQAWRETFAEHGVELSMDWWCQRLGRPSTWRDTHAELEALCGRSLDRELLKRRRKAREAELYAVQTAQPGVREYLEDARRLGLRVGIASSSSREWVCGHLEKLGLREFFFAIICAEDTTRHKPDPEPFLAAVNALGVPASDAIAFEDSPHGIASAKAAGLFCVAVPNAVTARLDLSVADLRVDSLAELPLSALLQVADNKKIVAVSR